jgi:hypothetical protein
MVAKKTHLILPLPLQFLASFWRLRSGGQPKVVQDGSHNVILTAH